MYWDFIDTLYKQSVFPTASKGGRALGHPRDDKSARYIWMYMFSGHKTDASF